MKAAEFCFWLQGHLEIAGKGAEPVALNAEQVAVVKNHLALVFKYDIDPASGLPPGPAQALHDGLGFGTETPPADPSKPLLRC